MIILGCAGFNVFEPLVCSLDWFHKCGSHRFCLAKNILSVHFTQGSYQWPLWDFFLKNQPKTALTSQVADVLLSMGKKSNNLNFGTEKHEKTLNRYCIFITKEPHVRDIFQWRQETDTINVVIFAGGNFAKMLARYFTWGLFSRYYSYFLHKGIRVLFSRGGNFRE